MEIGTAGKGVASRLRGRSLQNGVAGDNLEIIVAHLILPSAPFLIATRRILEIEPTHSQQKRKHFLIASFCRNLALAAPASNGDSRITRSMEQPASHVVYLKPRFVTHWQRLRPLLENFA
jgi:hypothetical protein